MILARILIYGSLALGMGVFLSSSGAEKNGGVTVEVRLVDAETGETVPGVVQAEKPDGSLVELENLISRGEGVQNYPDIDRWWVLAQPASVSLPREKLILRGFSGLETEIGEVTVDLLKDSPKSVRLPVRRFYKARQQGWQNANTHVHLQRIDRDESDKYLVDVATADGLDLVFVSYLERAEADVYYITNRYSPEELRALSTGDVLFGNGEEHRHNFGAGGEGFGHVMLLNIPKLVYPVSIGPGISKTGTDGIPLSRGIERAREMGGSVIWCHNAWGLEDIPSWLAGTLHANNIFDGGTHGSFEHSFYQYLNLGIGVPFSTGTDWFIYDFSRVYVPADQRLSPEQWLQRLREGRSYITNGPFLTFDVNGTGPGETLDLSAGNTVTVRGSAQGRVDFQRLELVWNGKVIQTVNSHKEAGHYEAALRHQFKVKEPGWLALRIPPPPWEAAEKNNHPRNEYGRDLFGHTSAVFVDVGNKRIFNVETARALIEELERSRKVIAENALFADDSERRDIDAIYKEALNDLKQRIAAHED